jgi:hypothetical protein
MPDEVLGNGFGCGHCWPPDAAAAWEARRRFSHVAELIDESHFIVTLRACPRCKQRFVSVFTETIDWADGDDPQYWTVLPVTAEEAAGLLREGEALTEGRLEALDPGRRCLRLNHPKDSPRSVFWGTGICVGWHD